MKRSNLVILILILVIPAGLLLHNLALRAAFPAVKAQPDYIRGISAQRYYKKLPPYNHIVLEGGVRLKSGKKKRMDVSQVNTQVWAGGNVEPGLEYRVDLKPFLRTEVRNDTLFCSFEADNPRSWRFSTRSSGELIFKAPYVKSIQADSVVLEIVQLVLPHPVSLQFTNMTAASIMYADVPRIDLKGYANYMHINSGKVDTLQYELGDNASLMVGNRLQIGSKKLVGMGKNAKFIVTGIIADSAMAQ